MKNSTIAIVAVVVVFVVVIGVYLGLSFTTSPTINPTYFRRFDVNGGPNQGLYTATFALGDVNSKNGPANGTIIMKMTDDRSTVLYQTTRTVQVSDYTQDSEKTYVYSWSIPASNIQAGMPNFAGYGYAQISFASTTGNIFSMSNAVVDIPELGEIHITKLSLPDNYVGMNGYDRNTWPTQKIYAGDIFTFTITTQIGWSTSIVPNINNVFSQTSGFTILSTNPALPIPNNVSGTNRISVTIACPNQSYSGELRIYLNGTLYGVIG